MRELVDRGPNGAPLQTLQDILEQSNREAERQRSERADAGAFQAFARRGRPAVSHQDFIAEHTGDDEADAVDQRRCEAELARWRADGGDFPRLRDLLGVPAARERASWFYQQTQLRQRAEQAEQSKTALEREVDRLRRQVAALTAGQDRVVQVLAERGY
ncbi:MAG TPA: hypothetical protein VIV12_27500 [Streptosporangiaceae bacterium]